MSNFAENASAEALLPRNFAEHKAKDRDTGLRGKRIGHANGHLEAISSVLLLLSCSSVLDKLALH